MQTFTVATNASLESLATVRYGAPRFWRLLAVMNLDRDLYGLKNMSAKIIIPQGTLLEWWEPSKFYNKSRQDVIQISAQDKTAAHDEMLELVDKGVVYGKDISFEQLSDEFKKREMGLVMTPANLGGDIKNLGELALKYYQAKKYWRLIQWANPGEIPADATADSPVPTDKTIWVVHIIP